jgi:hypothetical protein
MSVACRAQRTQSQVSRGRDLANYWSQFRCRLGRVERRKIAGIRGKRGTMPSGQSVGRIVWAAGRTSLALLGNNLARLQGGGEGGTGF